MFNGVLGLNRAFTLNFHNRKDISLLIWSFMSFFRNWLKGFLACSALISLVEFPSSTPLLEVLFESNGWKPPGNGLLTEEAPHELCFTAASCSSPSEDRQQQVVNSPHSAKYLPAGPYSLRAFTKSYKEILYAISQSQTSYAYCSDIYTYCSYTATYDWLPKRYVWTETSTGCLLQIYLGNQLYYLFEFSHIYPEIEDGFTIFG